MSKKIILVTCALPYANGSLHIGHMLEHIQADIWVRYQRMQNNEVYFISADDAHGTAIMLKSRQLNTNPEEMISNIHQEHYQDCRNFNISYNNYYSTHSKETYEILCDIYFKLKNNGFIQSRFISQLYDVKKNMFLPDRFIIGICPSCKTPEQYGDSCNQCGAIYTSIDLIHPTSVISGTTPILKKSEHFFFDLPFFTKKLYKWIHSGVLQNEIIKKVKEWFKLGLKQWDISRDEPYFGFKIPNTLSKYFYVWMDAPIGYMGTFKNFCKKNKNIIFQDFWGINSKAELYHFIGKDIIYFHSLFWPAILEGSNFRKPTGIFVHGHVTLNGSKISKSKGNIIKVNTYLLHLHADYLRYYYATKLSSKVHDIDLNFNDFITKVNSDLINKILNLASRNAKFIKQYNSNQLSNTLSDANLYKLFINEQHNMKQLFQYREFNELTRNVIKLADIANKYINQSEPWKTINKSYNIKNAICICSMGIQLFRVLIIYLKPILPTISEYCEKFLNTNLTWESLNTPLINHKINTFEIIYRRIQANQIASILNSSKLNNDAQK